MDILAHNPATFPLMSANAENPHREVSPLKIKSPLIAVDIRPEWVITSRASFLLACSHAPESIAPAIVEGSVSLICSQYLWDIDESPALSFTKLSTELSRASCWSVTACSSVWRVAPTSGAAFLALACGDPAEDHVNIRIKRARCRIVLTTRLRRMTSTQRPGDILAA